MEPEHELHYFNSGQEQSICRAGAALGVGLSREDVRTKGWPHVDESAAC